VVGGTCLNAFAEMATSAIENAAVAITIPGRELTVRCVKYSASRVAVPATNWAVRTPAQTMAPSGSGGGRVGIIC
jgi:hypothetical protein